LETREEERPGLTPGLSYRYPQSYESTSGANLMASGPAYARVQITSKQILQNPLGKTWCLHLEVTDSSKQSMLSERLLVQTSVSEPLPDLPQALELKALLRVRDLLNDQIKRMQSH
jgi:hypothetical protein